MSKLKTIRVFRVCVLAETMDGSRDVLGEQLFAALDAVAAQELARSKFWDERMSGQYLCAFRTEEVESPCWFCLEHETEGECNACGIDVCEKCNQEGACCDG